MAEDVSNELVVATELGMVMNLEPSLFVYFEEPFVLEDAEVFKGGGDCLASIPIRGCRSEGT